MFMCALPCAWSAEKELAFSETVPAQASSKSAAAPVNAPLAPLTEGGLIRLDSAQLAQLRRAWQQKQEPVFAAVNALIKKADKLLLRKPPTIVNGEPLAASGNPNDYFSFAPYWWANPDSADGLPWVRQDGKRNPLSSGPDTDKAAWNSFAGGISDLALAYFYTQDKRYAQKAADYARTWMLDEKTRMNPHLNYAQAIPGQFEGRNYGIIDFSRNHEMLDALLIIEPANVLTNRELKQVKVWIEAFFVWMLESPLGLQEKDEFNNHGTFYDAQVLAFALYLGDQDTAAQSVLRAKQRLAEHIAKNGSQPHELARTKPFSYSVFNLIAFTSIAAMAPRVGDNLWAQPAQSDSSMLRALNYILSRALEVNWGGEQEENLELDRMGALILAAQEQNYALNPNYSALLSQHLPEECLVRFTLPRTAIVREAASTQCHY